MDDVRERKYQLSTVFTADQQTEPAQLYSSKPGTACVLMKFRLVSKLSQTELRARHAPECRSVVVVPPLLTLYLPGTTAHLAFCRIAVMTADISASSAIRLYGELSTMLPGESAT